MNTGYLGLNGSPSLRFGSLQQIVLARLVVVVALWRRRAGCHGEDSVRAENNMSVRGADALTLRQAWVGGSLRGLERWVGPIEKSQFVMLHLLPSSLKETYCLWVQCHA